MKSFVTLFLCFIFSCGKLYAQSVVDNVSRKYSPWSVSAFTLVTQESDQSNEGGLVNSYSFIGPNYRLNNRERVALRVAFNANSNGYDRFNGQCVQSQDMALANPFVEYNNYQLGLLPGIADVFWSGRVYLPLSQSSRRKKTIARYRSNTIFTRHLTQKIFGEFRNEVNYFQQSSSTYFGTHTEDDCSIADNTGPSNTRQYRMGNWLSFWYRFNPRLSFGVQYILGNEGFNRTNTYQTSRQRFGRMDEIWMALGPVLRYQVSNNASFILSFRDVVEYSGYREERQDDLVELGEFRSRNTELAFLGFYRF